MQPTLTIMADFGFAPFAWLRTAEEKRPYVGINVGDAKFGFDEEILVSGKLQSELVDWARQFEPLCGDQSPDWKSWNETGIKLAKRLKQEIGKDYEVEYHVPFESPRNGAEPDIFIITKDGTAQAV